MKKTKEQKGITLVALIITIVVLLILAMVAIGTLQESKIIGHAQNATGLYEEEKEKEENEISNMISLLDKYAVNNKDDIEQVPSELEKYIMGTDKTGRNLIDVDSNGNYIGILDPDSYFFIDDPLTEGVNESETLGVETLIIEGNEEGTELFFYIKYQNRAYKVSTDTSTDTSGYLKTKKIETIYQPKGKEGQKTSEGWTILYDNGETLEAVSPTAMGELRLGYSETATDSETRLTEAIESYNTAITTINNYCKALEDLPTNIGVRSVGATETTTEKYTSDKLAGWNSKYNGLVQKGDTSWVQDLVRMAYHKVMEIEKEYWISALVRNDASARLYFGVRTSDGYMAELWYADSQGHSTNDAYSCAVRPIITIKN